MKTKFLLPFLCVIASLHGFGQTKDFAFRRKIETTDSSGWYSVELPPKIFSHLANPFFDLRIFKFSGNDTIESPYLLKEYRQYESDETISLPALNQSTKGKTQYATFEIPKGFQANYLHLEFEELNFDGFVVLEGSNDQREWFEIEKHQRIISIENANVNFSSTTLRFSLQAYRYLRIRIDADRSLSLRNASFKKRIVRPEKLDAVDLRWAEEKDKKTKQSIFSIDLKDYQGLVKLAVETGETTDYYRPFRLEILSDSSKTPKGWEYFYRSIVQGVISSVDSNRFDLQYAMAKKLRLVVENADNPFLKVTKISLEAPRIEMRARLEAGDYYLYYGNKNSAKPSYDLVHFEDKMPATFKSLSLAGEEKLSTPVEEVSPLIENKIWLWVLMGVIIGVLGFFTLKMMKGK